MWKRFKLGYRQLREDEPGRRFVNAHERWREHTRSSAVTIVLLLAATLLIIGGLLLGLIPGVPGIIPALLGVVLVAARFRRVAIWMDKFEVWLRRHIGRRVQARPSASGSISATAESGSSHGPSASEFVGPARPARNEQESGKRM